jgi:hypothetical protein
MIPLLTALSTYTLYCYAAYRLLLPPYDPHPTALYSLYTALHCYAAYSLMLPTYGPPSTAPCSLYTALLRCLQPAAPSL